MPRENTLEAGISSQVTGHNLNGSVPERDNASGLVQRIDTLEKKVAELEAYVR